MRQILLKGLKPELFSLYEIWHVKLRGYFRVYSWVLQSDSQEREEISKVNCMLLCSMPVFYQRQAPFSLHVLLAVAGESFLMRCSYRMYSHVNLSFGNIVTSNVREVCGSKSKNSYQTRGVGAFSCRRGSTVDSVVLFWGSRRQFYRGWKMFFQWDVS